MDDDSEQPVIPPGRLSDRELLAALLHKQATECRNHAEMLDLVAETDKRGLAVEKGYASTAALLMVTMRLSPREAKTRVAQATTAMPLTGLALAAGTITPEHVAEIHRVLAKAPATLSAEERRQAEQTLVTLAEQAPPVSVRRAGERLIGYWDLDTPPKDPPDPDRNPAGPRRRLTLRTGATGQMHVTGELDPESAALLTGLLEPLATPRPEDEFGQKDTRIKAQRYGDAFADVIALATRAPDVPTAGGDQALIRITITLEELERRAGSVYLDGIGYSSVSDLRRLCCDAKVIPAVLGTHGEVLDLGRARRLASPALTRALALRDKGCSRPGCHRAPRECQVHHARAWAAGGTTDIGNTALLCGHHHRELHATDWDMRMDNGKPVFIPPKWLDHEQKPIRNHAHDLPHAA